MGLREEVWSLAKNLGFWVVHSCAWPISWALYLIQPCSICLGFCTCSLIFWLFNKIKRKEFWDNEILKFQWRYYFQHQFFDFPTLTKMPILSFLDINFEFKYHGKMTLTYPLGLGGTNVNLFSKQGPICNLTLKRSTGNINHSPRRTQNHPRIS